MTVPKHPKYGQNPNQQKHNTKGCRRVQPFVSNLTKGCTRLQPFALWFCVWPVFGLRYLGDLLCIRHPFVVVCLFCVTCVGPPND